ncbi:MAG TPA: LytR C-terminal domain-containing protein [Actinomycetaceae bacterium]|nr:LytR C-terminal domain-containing protein [Actinomycetaceae bacterium]
MTIDPAEAQRRRAARRRRLQQRQTLIFGILITALLAVALLAAAMWGNVIPSPFSRPFSSPEPTEAAAPRVPCPPPDALPAPFSEISANVLNSTDQSGLAASTAGGLAQHGVQISQQSNYGGDIEGPATIVSGPRGLRAAYTVALLIPGSTVSLDGRDDAVIDVILGGTFDQVLDPETAGVDPEAPLTPPPGCSPVPEPTEDAAPEGEVVTDSPDDETEGSEEAEG